MAFKIETTDNALVITNTLTAKIVGEFPKRDVYFDNFQLELAVDPNVTFYDTNAVNATGSVLWEAELVDCVDSGLVPFTAATLRAFARVSLGFNIAPVPPPAAQNLQSVSTIGSTAAIANPFTVSVNQGLDDVSFLNLDGIGFGAAGTSIGFDDTINGGGVQSIAMEGSLGFFTGIQVTDASTNKGLFYAADYSANYSIRSLVDRGYVDVASTPQDLTSVLLAGNDVGANPLNVPSGSGGITFDGFQFAKIQAAPNGGIGIGTQDGGDLSLIPGLSSDMNLHLQPTATGKISIGRVVFGGYGIGITDTILSFSDEVGFKGFVYTADYSAAGILDPLWIPSYAAVQAAIPVDAAVAANTAKITNATHTGDVTGATVLAIGAKKVTAAMMADGVAGELFTFDNNGVISKIPVGTATHVLTSNGLGLAPTFQVSGGGGASPLTTKGDLFGFSTVDARLAVGTAFQKLVPDNNEATGLKWVTEVGTENVGITSGVTSGAATSGFLASTNNIVEYEIQGSNPGVSKIIYYSVAIPEDYKSGGTVNINSWTTDFTNLTTWSLTGYIEGTIDSVMNAVDITPTADLAYQLTNTAFADTITAGDVLQLKLNFTGSNGEDVRIDKITFTYNK